MQQSTLFIINIIKLTVKPVNNLKSIGLRDNQLYDQCKDKKEMNYIIYLYILIIRDLLYWIICI